MSIWRTKSIEQSIRDTDEPGHRLRKDLTGFDLIVFGIGVIIGTGIFVVTGRQAAVNAGPAIVVSFLIAGLVCALAAMCYAEFASTVPVAGSAYTFGYASLGEFVAWIIGWDLVLEFTLAASVVAVGWSGYAGDLLGVPTSLTLDNGYSVNFGAMFIVILLGVLGLLGTKLSGRISAVIVAIKVGIVLFIIVVGMFYVKTANWVPFVPPAQPAPAETDSIGHTPLTQVLLGLEPSQFGLWGVIAAASVVFFSFIGFDIVATTAEETKNPKRDMPIGIFGSLIIVTVLYMAVAAVVTGMRPYSELNSDAPLAEAFRAVGADWAGTLISLGGVIGITTVILVLMMGQSRVAFAMSRDGLLPRGLSKTHPRFGTPYIMTIITTVAVAVLAGFVPIAALEEMVNIGTLFAFVVVSIGVIVLRRTRPDLPRSFRAPFVPVLPIIAALACVWLMLNLTVDTWIRFIVWMAIGVVVYFAYGRRKSLLAQADQKSTTDGAGTA
ncbi:amino acid/polyamine/organocation transporter, APC superfamily [Marinactinospora thermotolerans DSM 45154]|uniref:Amino acid/polyamine/organocation transporter, APC superfamily n=1 Tax=Marinactinospora thermotolerans DSM 45154 TaxID=1122192 RepID=A0A1T4S2F8_9ACTN|nr:amino acid permease [Marinactinospora thermotolerans]SKA22423.1 amino acid/polyamine/organocation transporter, APC superfamily [Marinactinospora thermotolerans DSM 45154]